MHGLEVKDIAVLNMWQPQEKAFGHLLTHKQSSIQSTILLLLILCTPLYKVVISFDPPKPTKPGFPGSTCLHLPTPNLLM
jgi:hypothetical protein